MLNAPVQLAASAAAVASGAVLTSDGVLTKIVTAEMMGGVLDEVVGVLPVALPVMIGFIAVRKGISFIRSVLTSA